MKKYFPSKEIGYLQTNRSKFLGSIWSSFNLDFQTDLGVMKIAQKLVTNTTSSDDADLGIPSAFEYFDTLWFTIGGTRIFKNSDINVTSAFTEDASTGFQTTYNVLYSDLAIFDARLWSTTTTTLYSKVADGTGTGTWTNRGSLGNSQSHKLTYFKKFNRLYVINTNTTISSIDTANVLATTGDYSLDLSTSVGKAVTMVATSNYIYISTIRDSSTSSSYGTQGTILQWDGISAQASNEYILPTAGVLAMTVLDDIPYAIDGEGRILKFTGTSFEEISRLPIDRTLLIGSIFNVSTGRFVHVNGFQATKNNTLLIAINNLNYDTGSTINENLPSGIWEVDLATGNCTHRHSFTLKSLSSSTVTDYGQNRINGIGAIKINTLASNSSSGRGTLLAGASYFTDATTVKYGIFVDSPAKPTTDTEGQKKGIFVATWFTSDEVASAWDEIWATFRQFQSSTDSVVFKYRIKEETPIEATITWTSTTTFTTTTDVTAYWTSGIGGEVEIIQGTGSGSCTHITSIVNNAGTYTVTLEEAVTGVTGTAKARFQKWIKIFPKDTQSTETTWSQYTIGTDSTPRIQIKGCLTWTGDGEFYKFILNNNEDIKS